MTPPPSSILSFLDRDGDSNKTGPFWPRPCPRSCCRHSKCVSIAGEATVGSGRHVNWRRTGFDGGALTMTGTSPPSSSAAPSLWSWVFANTVVVVRRDMSRNCCLRCLSAAINSFCTSPTMVADGGWDLVDVAVDTSIVSGINVWSKFHRLKHWNPALKHFLYCSWVESLSHLCHFHFYDPLWGSHSRNNFVALNG